MTPTRRAHARVVHLVRQGLARDCERFSGGRYRAAERQAADEGATIRASYPLPGYCTPR